MKNKKYKIIIKEQVFTFDNSMEGRLKVKELMDCGLWYLELIEVNP